MFSRGMEKNQRDVQQVICFWKIVFTLIIISKLKMQKHDNELVKKSFLENNKKYNINRQVKEK